MSLSLACALKRFGLPLLKHVEAQAPSLTSRIHWRRQGPAPGKQGARRFDRVPKSRLISFGDARKMVQDQAPLQESHHHIFSAAMDCSSLGFQSRLPLKANPKASRTWNWAFVGCSSKTKFPCRSSAVTPNHCVRRFFLIEALGLAFGVDLAPGVTASTGVRSEVDFSKNFFALLRWPH